MNIDVYDSGSKLASTSVCYLHTNGTHIAYNVLSFEVVLGAVATWNECIKKRIV